MTATPACAASNKGLPFRKAAARAHWDPAGLPAGSAPGIHETAVVSPPVLGSPDDEDRIASAATFGFVIDLAAVEIDPKTGALRIDKYVSVHDVGRQLNPSIVEGQVHGGFVHGLGAALFEELAYDEQGNFLSGTFADYLCPTAVEVPPVDIGHVETASPANALGAKGMGDGSSMLAPAAIANAVADALGRDDIALPLTRNRLWSLANGRDPSVQRAARFRCAAHGSGALTGEGEVLISAPIAEVWRRLIDPNELAAIVPGCRSLTQEGPDHYSAQVVIGVAGIRGSYDAQIELRDKREGQSVRLLGKASGALGFGSGSGFVTLTAQADGRTRLTYRYEAEVGGKVAAVGQRMLGSVMRLLIAQFFRALEQRINPDQNRGWKGWLARLRPSRRNGGAGVKPVAFDYHRPETVGEAVALLAELREDAAVLAGGMTLGPMLNLRMVRPRAVIDVSRIAALKSIAVAADMLVTGAGVLQCDALRSEIIAREVPLLTMALPFVGHFQTRNRGTLGGSVAHADPSAEIPLCLVVCGGTVVLRSRRRERRVPAGEFFQGALTTQRQPNEMVTALEWPRAAPDAGHAFAEIAQRHGDFAIAAAACQLQARRGRPAG